MREPTGMGVGVGVGAAVEDDVGVVAMISYVGAGGVFVHPAQNNAMARTMTNSSERIRIREYLGLAMNTTCLSS